MNSHKQPAKGSLLCMTGVGLIMAAINIELFHFLFNAPSNNDCFFFKEPSNNDCFPSFL